MTRGSAGRERFGYAGNYHFEVLRRNTKLQRGTERYNSIHKKIEVNCSEPWAGGGELSKSAGG